MLDAKTIKEEIEWKLSGCGTRMLPKIDIPGWCIDYCTDFYNKGHADAKQDIMACLRANPDKYIELLKKIKECK